MNEKDLAEYCQEVGLGTIPSDSEDGDLFWSFMPNKPDNCISIYSTGGWPKDLGIPRKDLTFSVMFRATNYDTAQSMITDWEAVFIPQGIPKKCFYIGSHYIHVVEPMQPRPIPLGRDENGREKYSWNFSFVVHE